MRNRCTPPLCFPMQEISFASKTNNSVAHHTMKQRVSVNLAKVDLLYFTHALRKRGLFENVEMNMKHLFKAGDVVNIFQLSMGKGLMLEGQATVDKPIGNPQDEHYMVRFHRKDGTKEREAYERFIDREGQTDAAAYIVAFNKRLTTAA